MRYALRILLLPMLIGILFSGNGFAQAVLSGWAYRQEVVVTNPNGLPLQEHQVRLVLNTTVLVDAGKLSAGGRDLLFTDSDGRSQLCHWVENGIPDTATTVWVKVPYVAPHSAATLYLYYGNRQAEPADDGDCTFDLFDDFTASTLDSDRWAIGGSGTATVEDGKAFFAASGNDILIRSCRSFAIPVIAEMRVVRAAGRYGGLALVSGVPPLWTGHTLSLDESKNRMELAIIGPKESPCDGYSFLPSLEAVPGATVRGVWSLSRITHNEVFGNWPDGSVTLSNTSWRFDKMHVGLGVQACAFSGKHAGTLVTDWVRVRKFARREPAVVVGPEKPNGTAGVLIPVQEGVG